MKTGELYKFAFNSQEKTDKYHFFRSKNDAILNRQFSLSKVGGLQGKVFTVVDCEENPFNNDELIVQILFENTKFYILYFKNETVSWNQLKKLRDNKNVG